MTTQFLCSTTFCFCCCLLQHARPKGFLDAVHSCMMDVVKGLGSAVTGDVEPLTGGFQDVQKDVSICVVGVITAAARQVGVI